MKFQEMPDPWLEDVPHAKADVVPDNVQLPWDRANSALVRPRKNFAQSVQKILGKSFQHDGAANQQQWANISGGVQKGWNAGVAVVNTATNVAANVVGNMGASARNTADKVADAYRKNRQPINGAYGPQPVNASQTAESTRAPVNASSLAKRTTKQAVAPAPSASLSDKIGKAGTIAGATTLGGLGVASVMTGAGFGLLAAAAPVLVSATAIVAATYGVVKAAEMGVKLFKSLFGKMGMGPAAPQLNPQAQQPQLAGQEIGTDANTPKNQIKEANLNPAAKLIREKALKALADSIVSDLSKDGKNSGEIKKESLETLVGLSPADRRSVLEQTGNMAHEPIMKQATAQLGLENPGGVAALDQSLLQVRIDELTVAHQAYAQSR